MSGQDRFIEVVQNWVDLFMSRTMRGFIEYARESGLSMTMIGALFHLNRRGSAGVTGLGEHLGVTSAAASQMLDKLVHQGLIQRTEHPDDRRVKQIVLTDQGCKLLEKGLRARQDWLKKMAAELTPHQKDQVISALNLMIDKSREND